jgi:hypothetical protein
MKKAIIIFLSICLTYSCTTKTFYFTNGNKETQYVYRNNKIIKQYSWHESGKKRLKSIYRKNKLIKTYSWYESGKRESISKIISSDTVILYDTYKIDSVITIRNIKQKRIDWYEDGELKEIEIPCKDGIREIISYDWNEKMRRKTTYSMDKVIKEEVLNQNNNSHSINTFSKKWKTDSIGKKGYRYNFHESIVKDTIPFNLAHLKKERVIELLGEPNKIAQDGLSLVFYYFLTGYCAFSEEGCYRFVLEIKFENGIEVKHYTSFIKTSNKKQTS